MPAEARLHAIIEGRVQGVSFRYYTVNRARELGVVGYVRNLWDQTVEVMAEGDRVALEKLLSYLRQGPRAALVTHVSIEWSTPTDGFRGFEVRY